MATVKRYVEGERLTTYIAKMVGKSSDMDHAAELVRARVRREIAGHTRTGALMSSVKIATVPGRKRDGRLVDDRLIYSDDPAILSIEFGATTHGGTPPPGQLNFTKAFSKIGW